MDRVSCLTAEEGTGPEPGDASLCINCCEWSVFAEDLSLRKPTPDELITIGLDPDARRTREIILQFKSSSPQGSASH